MELLTRLLLWSGPAAAPVLAAFIIWAAVRTPGYSHLRHNLSQLGARGRPGARIMGAGFVVYGLLVVTLASGLLTTLEAGPLRPAAYGGLLAYGVGLGLSGVLRDDLDRPGVEASPEGRLHRAFVWLAWLGLLVGMIFLGLAVDDRPGWEFLAPTSFAMAMFLGALGTIFQLFPPRLAGLQQRIQFLIAVGWLTLVSLTALGYVNA